MLMSLSDADAEICEYVVKPNTKIANTPIKDLEDFPRNAIIGGVIRGEKSFITIGDSIIRPYDKVVVFSRPEAVPEVEDFFN